MSSRKQKQYGNKRDYIAKELRENRFYQLKVISPKTNKPPKKLRVTDVVGRSPDELEDINE